MIRRCPNCHRVYETALDRPEGDNRPIQEIFPNEPLWKREQLITGLCSDQCWDEYLRVNPSWRDEK